MKAITLRNLSPNVARTVQRRAKQKKTSVNKAVIELLEESAEGKRKKKAPVCYHDLDHLVGTWTKEEADAFETAERWAIVAAFLKKNGTPVASNDI